MGSNPLLPQRAGTIPGFSERANALQGDDNQLMINSLLWDVLPDNGRYEARPYPLHHGRLTQFRLYDDPLYTARRHLNQQDTTQRRRHGKQTLILVGQPSRS